MNILLILGIVAVLVIVIIISYYLYKKSRTCNKNNCDNLVTLSNWEVGSETSDKATLIKKCTNIKTNIDGCSQLDPTTLTKEVNWSDITCNKACGVDANGYKSATFENNKYTSKNTYPCNTEPCDSLVNFGNWTLKSETPTDASLTRTCQNKDNTRDACSLIPSTDLNKSVPWSNSTACSKVCDSGINNKTVVVDNTTFTSTTTYPCNTEVCTTLVNLSEWVSNDNDISVVKSCTNKDNNKNACSLVLPTVTKKVNAKYPPKAVPNNTESITDNNITYKFSNQGANGSFSAWTFDYDIGTWTWYDGVVGSNNPPSPTNYNTTTGDYLGKASSTNNITGSWHQMEVSTPVIINGYFFNTSSPFKTWFLFASNDGNTWTQIDSQTNNSLPINKKLYYFINNTTSYKFYRFVINKSMNAAPNLIELQFLNVS